MGGRGGGVRLGLEMSSTCRCGHIAVIPQGMKHSVRSLIICRGKEADKREQGPLLLAVT